MTSVQPSTAYSIDGRSFSFQGPVDRAALGPGSYVILELSGGREFLGQIYAVEAVPGRSFAHPLVQGNGSILVEDGTAVPWGFTSAALHAADPEKVRQRIEVTTGSGGLEIGELIDAPGVPAMLRAEGFTRHTFLCGQSGSGKTYAAGKVLERLLYDTQLPILIVDPNSDYVGLGEMLPLEGSGLNEADYRRADARRSQWADRFRVIGRERGGGLRLWLGNLTPRQQLTVLGLDPIADAEEVAVVREIVQKLGTTRYTPTDLARVAAQRTEDAARRLRLRIENLGLDRMEVWADSSHAAIGERIGPEWRAVVLDLGSLRTPRERSIISAAAISYLWEQRENRRPVLLVIDEAHNVCPQDPREANQAIATEDLITLAGEGRKFGIYLALATQRPSKIHENVLSQCDNLILMRMNSAEDIARLTTVFSMVPASLIGRSSSFRLGEGLAYGKIAPDPLFFRTGSRLSPEGGVDVPTDWANR